MLLGKQSMIMWTKGFDNLKIIKLSTKAITNLSSRKIHTVDIRREKKMKKSKLDKNRVPQKLVSIQGVASQTKINNYPHERDLMSQFRGHAMLLNASQFRVFIINSSGEMIPTNLSETELLKSKGPDLHLHLRDMRRLYIDTPYGPSASILVSPKCFLGKLFEKENLLLIQVSNLNK